MKKFISNYLKNKNICNLLKISESLILLKNI